MQGPTEPLSDREREILRLVATGAANKEIANQLVISPNTVKVHLRNIFAKIGVASRTEATLYAINAGLIKPGLVSLPSDEPATDNPENAGPDLETSVGPAITPEDDRQKPGQKMKLWWVGIVVFAVLLLAFFGLMSQKLFFPTSTPPTAASATQVQAPTQIPQTSREKKPLALARKGMAAVEYDNAFYLAGGETNQGVDNAMLRYDPANDQWEQLADKPTPVTAAQAALLGEKIYIPGGQLPDGTQTDVLEVYDPRQDTWEMKAALPVSLSAYALAAFEGQIYLFGGISGSAYVSTVYSYNPDNDSWNERSPLSSPRAFAGTANLNEKILVIGGFDGQTAFQQNEAYFPNRDSAGEPAWEILAPLPSARYGMGVAQLAGFVFVIGGTEGDSKAIPPLRAFEYSISADQWNALETLPIQANAYSALLISGNNLYQVGGESSSGLSASNQSYQAIYTIAVPIIGGGE